MTVGGRGEYTACPVLPTAVKTALHKNHGKFVLFNLPNILLFLFWFLKYVLPDATVLINILQATLVRLWA